MTIAGASAGRWLGAICGLSFAAFAAAETVPTAAPIPKPTSAFAGAPVVPQTAKEFAEGEAPEIYVVEEGDTLIDICDQLLDEPGYWPKLWALNPYIKNPHFIWPGMRLTFYAGTRETPPHLEVADENDLVPVDKEVAFDALIAQRMHTDGFGEHRVTPVIGIDEVLANNDLLQVVGSLYTESAVEVQIPGLITEDTYAPLCTVLGGAGGENMVGEDQRFVCRYGNETPDLNRTLTVLRYADQVDDYDEGGLVGYRYEFVAHVQLKSTIEGEDMAIGAVTKSQLGVEKGDIVVPYVATRRMMNLSEAVPVKTSRARIAGLAPEGASVAGAGSLIYIDKGSNGGYREGQTLRIHQFLHDLVNNGIVSAYPQQTELVGTVRIIATTPVGSIGYITQNTREIMLNDLVGL